LRLEKFDPKKVYTCVFFDADQEYYYIKRFQIDGSTNGKLQTFIGDNPHSRMVLLSDHLFPNIEVRFGGQHSDREPETISSVEFIGLKSFKARGKRLTNLEVKKIKEVQPTEPDDELIILHYGEDFLKDVPNEQDESDAETESIVEQDLQKEEIEKKPEAKPEKKPEKKTEQLPEIEPKKKPKKSSNKKSDKEEENPPKDKDDNPDDNPQMTLGL
jgi:topoisomerase-4 subunit A